jgi:ABC-type dipeptide/oligopeptide/nickel transport system ATPase subunit
MKFDIERENEPDLTYRVQSVIGKFDLQSNKFKEHFEGDIKIELDKNWQIGLIVGNSGTGKSTIAKELFPDFYVTKFDYLSKSIIDDMPVNCSVDEIVKTFNSVGFSSPVSWLKPYNVLSNGEKMRVDLAYSLLMDKNLVVFDEYTSVVDRNVAKIGSLAIQKAVRRVENKQFIAVGCHFDIEEWLDPDWVFNTNTMEFYSTKKKSLKLDMNYGKQWINQCGRCLVNTII